METPCTQQAPQEEPSSGDAHSVDALRIIDAAANRCREGMRVAEDFVRFHLDDRHLLGLLKGWRHDFSQSCRLLDALGLVAARNTPHDVGTDVHTAGEWSRTTLDDVVHAAFKRVAEASRSLEEFGKLVSRDFAEQMAALRYRAYTLEKAVLSTRAAQIRLAEQRVCLLVTCDLCPQGAEVVIRAALDAGVRMVQVREKSLPDRELLAWARRVRQWTAQAGALCLINDRADIARLAQADGVHVGQDDLPVPEARRIVGPRRLVGVSTHTLEQARAAVLSGADYIGVGPVFRSATKSFENLAGLELVRQVAAEISLPAFAIGGIQAENVAEVLSAGARRVAVSRALCGAADPGEAARVLLSVRGEAPGGGV
ncbi:MAG: thiamine phosphate synthase [Planctomycetaceae bacterium]